MIYFAYGSNMSQKKLIDKGIKIKDATLGVLFNYELSFNKQSSKIPEAGFANVMPKYGCKVEGVLYHIEDEDIVKMDKWEGYPKHYNREWVYVYDVIKNTICLSMMYFAQKSQLNENLKPTGEYLNYLLDSKSFVTKEYYSKLQSIKIL